jgi:hypothetical protein
MGNFESLADWFRNAGAFHDSHGQPTGKDIPVLTLLKLPINAEKQYAKENRNGEGGNRLSPRKEKGWKKQTKK